MNSVIVNIVVEGPSERNFIHSVVTPYLAEQGVYVAASVVGKAGHKGGNVKFERVLTDIKNYLKQRDDTFVSTMVDYFRLDTNWPGMDEIQSRLSSGETVPLDEKSRILQQATLKSVSSALPDIAKLEERFIPYIQMHEFEALLFSDANILAAQMKINLNDLQLVIDEYETPEHINTDPIKAPSKRIAQLAGYYKKVRQSLPIAQQIGLTKMRQQCQLFNQWLNFFERKVG